MLGGPICHFELIRTARRRWFFRLRFAVGLVLLGSIGLNYAGLVGPVWLGATSGGVESYRRLADFGRMSFVWLMFVQAVMVIGLTPSLVADAIVSERSRKTLHDLLTTRLTGGEIVRGKLGARLLVLLVLMALFLPVVSLLTLFGGIDPVQLLATTAALVSTAFFAASLSIVASVVARTARGAAGLAYALTAGWLFLPAVGHALAPAIDAMIGVVWPGSPFDVLGALGPGGGSLGVLALRMAGTQLVWGAIVVALAGRWLRPMYRRHEGRAGRAPRLRRIARRWSPVPPCGDDPVAWREAYFASGGSTLLGQIGRRAARLVGALILLGMLIAALPSFEEVWEYGYFGTPDRARGEFNGVVRTLELVLCACWLLWLASVSGASFASERERDTWLGLLATPLTGPEIISGKIKGSLRATRGPVLLMAALLVLGTVSGAIHPIGALLGSAAVGVFGWYTAVLGTYHSLKSKTSRRAQAIAQGILIVPHLCCVVPSPLYVLGFALISYRDFSGIVTGLAREQHGITILCVSLYLLVFGLLYVFAPIALARTMRDRFDALAGRPQPHYTPLGVTDPKAGSRP